MEWAGGEWREVQQSMAMQSAIATAVVVVVASLPVPC